MTTTWSQGEDSTIDELMRVAGRDDYRDELGTPWKDGHDFVYKGIGGVHILGAQHVTIAGDSHVTHLSGDRDMTVGGDLKVTTESDWLLARAPDSGNGKENLHVKGDMNWNFHDRTLIGSGTVERTWHGAVGKVVGLEGVICGGAWSRMFLGGAMNVTAITSSDLYGGSVRGSAARNTVAGIGYRSCDFAVWRMAQYNRQAHATIEPLVGTVSQTPENESRLRFLAAKLGMTIMPFAFIFWGAVTMVPSLLYALVQWLDTKFFAGGQKRPAPQPMVARARTRTVSGVEVAVRQNEVFI